MNSLARYEFILQAYKQKDVKSNKGNIYIYVKNTDAIGKHFMSSLIATQITMAK